MAVPRREGLNASVVTQSSLSGIHRQLQAYRDRGQVTSLYRSFYGGRILREIRQTIWQLG